MRSPTKISPKWCGFRSSCTTACAPRGNSGEGAAQKPLAAAQRARARGGAPRAGVDSAGSSGVQPLLEHTPHDPPPLARKRAAYSTRTAPTGCHRAQPAVRREKNPTHRQPSHHQPSAAAAGGAQALVRTVRPQRSHIPCWRTAARCRRGGTSCRSPRRPAETAIIARPAHHTGHAAGKGGGRERECGGALLARGYLHEAERQQASAHQRGDRVLSHRQRGE